MTKRLFIYPVVMALFVIGCNKLGEQTSEPANQAETTQTAQVNNWLLGQWTSDYGEGFELMEACRRPDSQFGKKYVYWRDDVDGDPHEELNKVDEYLIDGNSIKMRIVPPTSVE
ncbi:MAG TPA: hypothetical protein VFV57_08325, partial [Limnobacter sp.]|nr:hypothetical protein [Limnobacter sp.]